MTRLRQLWAVWQHGALLALVYALTTALAFLAVSVLALLMNAALGLAGNAVDEAALFRLVSALFPVWVPLGLGLGARYASADRFKPQGYPEHV